MNVCGESVVKITIVHHRIQIHLQCVTEKYSIYIRRHTSICHVTETPYGVSKFTSVGKH